MNSGKAAKAVISVPIAVHRTSLKLQEKARLKRLEQIGTKYFEGHRDLPPIISCRVSQLNHYRGQVYRPDKKLPLASEHWLNRGSIGDFFSFVPFHGNYATHWNEFALRKAKEDENPDTELITHLKSPTFGAYGIDSRIVATLERLGFKHPTNIQEAAIPRLLSGENAIIAAETGNGKTLAFLLPILQQILELKSRDKSLSHRPLNSPLALIVTPGRELAEQIYEVAQKIGSEVGIEASLQLGGSIKYKILHGERKQMDIVVGSLGGLQKMFANKYLNRNFVQNVVLDEADTLVDDTFQNSTIGFLGFLTSQAAQTTATGVQFMFVSATFPTNIRTALRGLMETDNLSVIRSHYLHRILSHVRHKFIRAPKVGKPAYLLDIIEKDIAKARPVLIFSNKSSTASFVSHFLQDRGVDCREFSANIGWRGRGQILDEFLAGKFKLLSCTDLVSRGIDTTNLRHVVNYDFPSNVSDYLHRAGRVGRVRSAEPQGLVTSLVSGQRSIGVVQSMERAVRTNTEISDVDSNIIRVIRRHHGDDGLEEEEPHRDRDENERDDKMTR